MENDGKWRKQHNVEKNRKTQVEYKQGGKLEVEKEEKDTDEREKRTSEGGWARVDSF